MDDLCGFHECMLGGWRRQCALVVNLNSCFHVLMFCVPRARLHALISEQLILCGVRFILWEHPWRRISTWRKGSQGASKQRKSFDMDRNEG